MEKKLVTIGEAAKILGTSEYDTDHVTGTQN